MESPVEPGLHPGIEADVYHRWPLASQTVLKIMRERSPAHAKAYMDNPPQPTPAMRLGDAVHVAVLQPDLFESRYIVQPNIDRRTKAGKEEWNAFLAENDGKRILTPDEWAQCLAIRDAVHSHPVARRLVTGRTELSAVWQERWYGVMCKGRFDAVPDGLGVIVDLKTTSDASPRAFSRDVFRLGYHIQGAMYLMGAQILGLKVDLFAIVAVEKEPPYAVAVYNVRDDALAAGETELGRLLKTWAECLESGHWPGYPEKAVDISLPEWAFAQIERAESA